MYQPHEHGSVDVVPIIREATEAIAIADPDRPINVNVPEVATVEGDRLHLRQVIDNLVSNVRTRTPAGTAVTVSVTSMRNQVEIAVADARPGIAAEDPERLLDRFWRADRARTRSRGGTGVTGSPANTTPSDLSGSPESHVTTGAGERSPTKPPGV